MQNAKFRAIQYVKDFELAIEKMHFDALNLYAKY